MAAVSQSGAAAAAVPGGRCGLSDGTMSVRSGVGDTMATVAVTGSTGRLGGRVARRLEQTGTAQRLLVREATRAPRIPGAEVRQAEYGDRDAVAAALVGVQTALMV